MKEQDIDSIFRQKLQDHKVHPSAAAWEQLSSNLQTRRRRKRGGWYVAAAALALLLTAGGAWLSWQQTPSTGAGPDLANNIPDAIPTSPVIQAPAAVVETPAATEEEAAEVKSANSPAPSSTPAGSMLAATPTPKAAPKPASQLKSQPKEVAPAPMQELLEQASEEQELLASHEVETPEEEGSTSPELEIIPDMLPKIDQTTAVASAERVVIQYKPTVVASVLPAPTSTDKENAPEKVFSFLQKVKQGDVGLADIRQAKDDLFAIRFSKP